MSLADRTRAVLDERGVRYVLIGAMAIGVYGLLRSTKDTDFLTVDSTVLDEAVWTRPELRDARVNVLRGDAFDPLAGTVRLVRGREQVDVVVGKWKWELAVIDRAQRFDVGHASMMVPRAADLVLLKLSAGGPKDMWDIHGLFGHLDRETTMAEIDARMPELPQYLREAWQKLRPELAERT